MKSFNALVSTTLCAAMVGCAAAPHDNPVQMASLSCNQLDAQIAQADSARRVATEEQKNAWRVVVPFAVAARYANGHAAIEQAEQRLAMLMAESVRQGCPRHGQ